LEKQLADFESASRRPPPDDGVKQERVAELESDLRIAEQKVSRLAPLEKDLQDQRKSFAVQEEAIAQLKKERAITTPRWWSSASSASRSTPC